MRLKTMDNAPLIRHSTNNSLVQNSPKRINTLQNSNLISNNLFLNKSSLNNTRIYNNSTTNFYNTTTEVSDNFIDQNSYFDTQDTNNFIENNCTTGLESLNTQWLDNNTHNNARNLNISLATECANFEGPNQAPFVCPEQESPGSSGSSPGTPQDEDNFFDTSDGESLSEETNDPPQDPTYPQEKKTNGITNPNYPGFQHFAHTLLTAQIPSVTDLIETVTGSPEEKEISEEQLNNNNENNNNEEVDLQFDTVNRLDSVENIQKVFCEKNLNSNLLNLNIPTEEKPVEASRENIIGDFEKEVEHEFGKISLENSYSSNFFIDDLVEPELKRACFREIEQAIEKLTEALDLEPSATRYNIEPNTEQPFSKTTTPVVDIAQPIILQDSILVKMNNPLQDAYLTKVPNDLQLSNKDNLVMDVDHKNQKEPDTKRVFVDSNRAQEETGVKKIKSTSPEEKMEKFCKENISKTYKEKEVDSTMKIPRKREKLEHVRRRKDYSQQIGSLITFPKKETRHRENPNRKSFPMAKDKKKASSETFGSFDVYNIETAMPKIDLEAIEQHLRQSREEERRRRTDREEIRRRLAMGTSEEDYFHDRPGRKPSLQARLQSGMNLQICFMNEAVSDTESPSSDSECPLTNPKQPKSGSIRRTTSKASLKSQDKAPTRPDSLALAQPLHQGVNFQTETSTDFFTKQARLQTEARMALAQAKEMARMQMEIEKQRQKKSPITEMVRCSMEKVGIPFPEDKRRLSRQILTEMNVAQLQVIVNDLHTQIEGLNESLVRFLMNRDDLHMEQDSKLVDIEDLTRYLGDKEQILKDQTSLTISNNSLNVSANNNFSPHSPPSPAPSTPLTSLNSVKPHFQRIANLVKK